jgi:hypothetical protein
MEGVFELLKDINKFTHFLLVESHKKEKIQRPDSVCVISVGSCRQEQSYSVASLHLALGVLIGARASEKVLVSCQSFDRAMEL